MRLVKIKVDKEKKQVIFQCKTVGEVEWTLDAYIKGMEKIGEEAREAFESKEET